MSGTLKIYIFGWGSVILTTVFLCYSIIPVEGDPLKFSSKDVLKYRKEVKKMFYHAYDSYMMYAFPYDELRPLTCDGHDTWGSYSLTLIDALDTLAVMENKTEFKKVVDLIIEREDFEADINVSVFETNIRIVGGLLSGHLLSRKMGVELEQNWPCEGPLLRLAVDAATRLLPAFDTPTGMPYGTVNLKTGVPHGETPVTCAAGVGTFIVEFGAISRLTGNPVFEDVALRAIHAMWKRRSKLDLIGNHIDVVTGHWTANDAGIGAGVDSFFEYLAKGSFLLQRPELMSIFNDARRAIDFHLRHEDWYLWKTMQRGQLTMAVFQSLEAFWPGILTLVGDVDSAKKTIFNYHQVLSQYGFHPEFYNIVQGSAYVKRSGYPLRPEFVESLVYLYQATKDTTYLKMGADLVRAINHSAKTKCGYATVENVVDHSLDNRMESFFLAETTKYLYLLFSEDHWLLSSGSQGRPLTVDGRICVVEAGGYFFNTEAHPIDTGALSCCTGPKLRESFLPKEKIAQFIFDPKSIANENVGQLLRKKKLTVESGASMSDEVSSKDKPQGPQKYDSTLEDLAHSQMAAKKNFKYIVPNVKTKEIKTSILPPVKIVETVYSSPAVPTIKEESEDSASNSASDVENHIEIDDSSEETEPDDDIDANEEMIAAKKDHFEAITTENDTKNKYDNDDIGLNNGNKGEVKWKSLSTPGQSEVGGFSSAIPELSAIATSVSSSKSISRISDNRIVERDSAPVTPKPKKVFSMSLFKQKLSEDMELWKNVSLTASYSLLHCPVETFVQSLSFKGLMVNIDSNR